MTFVINSVNSRSIDYNCHQEISTPETVKVIEVPALADAKKDSPACKTTDRLSIVKTELPAIVTPDTKAEEAATGFTIEKLKVTADADVLAAITLLIIAEVDAGHV